MLPRLLSVVVRPLLLIKVKLLILRGTRSQRMLSTGALNRRLQLMRMGALELLVLLLLERNVFIRGCFEIGVGRVRNLTEGVDGRDSRVL